MSLNKGSAFNPYAAIAPLTPFRLFESGRGRYVPEIDGHFAVHSVMPELYLNEWIMTLFTRTLSFDTASQLWDIFFLEVQQLRHHSGPSLTPSPALCDHTNAV